MENLELPCICHPKTYKTSLFKKEWKFLVSQMCRFVIGRFEDEIYFDVHLMDACHMLIGRASQFDHNVQRDGRKILPTGEVFMAWLLFISNFSDISVQLWLS